MMATQYDLKRFVDAQETTYATALAEIRNGKKQGHWMWFVFPQFQGLGFSPTSKFYAINDVSEAQAYSNHTILGSRLVEICTALLLLQSNDANRIFGSPDDAKLKSSMTLFASLQDSNPVFQLVLDKFYNGAMDMKTLELITAKPKS